MLAIPIPHLKAGSCALPALKIQVTRHLVDICSLLTILIKVLLNALSYYLALYNTHTGH